MDFNINIAQERAYPTTLANSTLLPLMLLSLASQKNSPTPTQTPGSIFLEYDYIVVGAGSAGATVAARLSEIPCVTVLLLEAGKAPPILNEIPAFARNFWFTDIDWQYKTVPQKFTGRLAVDRQIIWPSGKGLGGSTLLNAMLNIRGNRKNYDDWAAQGAQGWSFEEVLPYFNKLEENRNPEYVANGYHGVNGPVTVERALYEAEMRYPLFQAARDMGYRIVDPNGPIQTGYADFQDTIRNGQRCSTAKAYLVPAEKRSNLHILPNAFVTKILTKNRKAIGVSFEMKGSSYKIRAKREVIMSAGTINTAQILMLSGIGPKSELRKFNIPVVADLPVGENLQEHCSAVLNFELDPRIPPLIAKVTDENNILDYIENREGILNSPEGISGMAFLNSRAVRPNVDDPNFQLYFAEALTLYAKVQFGLTPEAYEQVYGPYENSTFYVCLAQTLQPKSRGCVNLNSSNPYDPPLINPNYLEHPQDLRDIVEGMKACYRFGTSEAMQTVGSKPFNTYYPGCEKFLPNMDKYFKCQAQALVVTMNHQVGTAKMGHPEDPSTVVDPLLRVKGIKGLRVVDASVMPIIPSGNTNVPTIMIAEKASDIIKQTITCY